MEKGSNALQRVKEINDTFNHKHPKSNHLDTLTNKLTLLKKKMNNVMIKNIEQIQKLKTNSLDLLAEAEKSNSQYENEAKEQMDELQLLYEEINRKIEAGITNRKTKEHQILMAFDTKVEILRKQIQNEKRIRQQLFQQVSQTLEDDVPSIMNELLQGKEEFAQNCANLLESSNQLFEENHESLDAIHESNQENQKKTFNLIKDLARKVKSEIEEEKEVCEATHEEVLNYVEEAYSQMTQNLSS